MGIGDWLILGALAVLVFFAAWYAVRHRGSCGSCQGCSGGRENCGQRDLSGKQDKKLSK